MINKKVMTKKNFDTKIWNFVILDLELRSVEFGGGVWYQYIC